jgi:1-deoxy-D-xylulose-5-phosphate reductoisomerase
MRVPISYCLGWPDRVAWAAPKLDLKRVGSLSFFEPDTAAFPMLRLAREALQAGLSGVYNAANEVCVQAFLEKRIDFLQVAEFVEMAMMRAQLPSMASIRHASRDRTVEDMDIALDIDSGVRELVGGFVAGARQGA